MITINHRRAALALALLLTTPLLSACGGPKEKPVSTEPTAANSQPYPGMENAKGTSLRVGREGAGAPSAAPAEGGK